MEETWPCPRLHRLWWATRRAVGRKHPAWEAEMSGGLGGGWAAAVP